MPDVVSGRPLRSHVYDRAKATSDLMLPIDSERPTLSSAICPVAMPKLDLLLIKLFLEARALRSSGLGRSETSSPSWNWKVGTTDFLRSSVGRSDLPRLVRPKSLSSFSSLKDSFDSLAVTFCAGLGGTFF